MHFVVPHAFNVRHCPHGIAVRAISALTACPQNWHVTTPGAAGAPHFSQLLTR